MGGTEAQSTASRLRRGLEGGDIPLSENFPVSVLSSLYVEMMMPCLCAGIACGSEASPCIYGSVFHAHLREFGSRTHSPCGHPQSRFCLSTSSSGQPSMRTAPPRGQSPGKCASLLNTLQRKRSGHFRKIGWVAADGFVKCQAFNSVKRQSWEEEPTGSVWSHPRPLTRTQDGWCRHLHQQSPSQAAGEIVGRVTSPELLRIPEFRPLTPAVCKVYN